jgi:hypothetical protein
VQLDNGVTLDFSSDDHQTRPEHYAFLVSETEFDCILARIQNRISKLRAATISRSSRSRTAAAHKESSRLPFRTGQACSAGLACGEAEGFLGIRALVADRTLIEPWCSRDSQPAPVAAKRARAREMAAF